jgi:hypothetical protein
LLAVVLAGPVFVLETVEEGLEGGGDETEDMVSPKFRGSPLSFKRVMKGRSERTKVQSNTLRSRLI